MGSYYSTYGSNSALQLITLLAAYFTFLLAIFFVIYIITVIASWKIFAKAGIEGWKSLIPIYNSYLLYEIAWGNGWLFLLNLIPFVNIVVPIIFSLKLAKSFGKGTGFGIGLIFLQPIFLLILAFGNSRYLGPDA